MGRPASPYTRVTEVASFVNSAWKEYWFKSIENGNKEKNIPGLMEIVAQECIEFSKTPHSASEWQSFLAARTAMKEADRISRESAEYGKCVHAIAEAHLLGQPAPTQMDFSTKVKQVIHKITDREKFSGNLIVDWCKQANVKPVMVPAGTTGIMIPAVELELISEQHKIIGHPDLINTFGDDPTIWVTDWKTSKEAKIDYILQLAAYAQMFFEKYGKEIQNGVIARTPSDPNVFPQFETHPFTELRSKYFPLFLEALDVVHFFKRKGKWKEVKEAA